MSEELSRHQPYAENQPKDGETILVCGHVGSRRNFHWFYISDEFRPFKRPDGTLGESRWIALCEECFAECKDDLVEMISDDITWMGDEPAIRQMRPS